MSEPVLSVSGLRKSFHKDSVEIAVLKGVDLTVEEGDFVTIMGPSGAGKSTLLYILGTLDAPTEGAILYRGRNIREFTRDEENRFRNEKVGFVFQFYHLLQDFNVIENITIPLLIKGIRMREALERAEVFLDIMGLKERRNHRPGELSGGEQQRVAIARALVNEPEIILADEPTGNLDRKTGQEVLRYMLAVKERLGAILIMVTHDPEIGGMGGHHFHMVDGELFSSGG
jgi:ABC-type lipoprotein export system ATPase subunit